MMRRSGIFLPIPSLPSRYGIGEFGPEAYRFVEGLHATRQRVWEILPLLIPDGVGSSFDSPSAFALNWMLVSPEVLLHQKLLSRSRAQAFERRRDRIAYGESNVEKRTLIGYALAAFRDRASPQQHRRFVRFQQRERWWLEDYALFMAIKDRHGGQPWWTWTSALRNHQTSALRKWTRRYHEEMAYFCFGQWIAHEQWQQVKRYANERGIRILGDLPFFVVHDSADVWAHQTLFQMTQKGKLTILSGAPPDLFYSRGQTWGNPLYAWKNHRRESFRWWISRFRKALSFYDELRLDHFRGYKATWTIPARSATAARGYWIRTPGEVLLRGVRALFPSARLIAEDLGKITPKVYQLRDRFGLIGTRVLQFGFHPLLRHLHHPETYPSKSAAYSSTHDLPTLREWMKKISSAERQNLQRVLPRPTLCGLLSLLYASKSDTVILPLHDLLGLGENARLNRPGRVEKNNWTWRLPPHALTRKTALALSAMTRKSGRTRPSSSILRTHPLINITRITAPATKKR
ncbi:MAG: 4-alpha-glucanotransferase [bacterium]